MASVRKPQNDDVTEAPESGTLRNETSGNAPSDRGTNPGQRRFKRGDEDGKTEPDDPSTASEEA